MPGKFFIPTISDRLSFFPSINPIQSQESGCLGHEFGNILVMMEPCRTRPLGLSGPIFSHRFGSRLKGTPTTLLGVGVVGEAVVVRTFRQGNVAGTFLICKKIIHCQDQGIDMKNTKIGKGR